MVEMLVKVFIGLGLIMLVCGIIIKVYKAPAANNKLDLMKVLENVAANKIIKLPLNFLTRDKTLWTNKTALKILNLSESGISLQQLYIIKFICMILCILLIIIISYTNADYKTRLIIGSSNIDQSIIYQDKEYDEGNYRLYVKVLSQIGQSKLEEADDTGKFRMIEEEMTECLNTTDSQLVLDNTKWFLESWRKVQNIRIIEFYHFGILFFAFILPELFLIISWLLRGCVFKKEIIKLEYIFELLARIDGIKTLDIIYQLQKSSKIYSKYFFEFTKIFKYDKKKGFKYLKNKNIKSLIKLAEILEIYCISDREIALQILEREVIERDESMLMTADETIDMIDLVAFLSIIPLVYELVMLMLNPMLEVVYKAFEFI